jgi:ubiquinone/menaquinone biosynthesis C-methylase UbiE
MTEAPNAAQAEFWNQTAGTTWVQLQDQLDRQIEGVGLEAMRALSPGPGECVLDVGCGCGQTTLELAARVGETGAVTGVDISTPMLEVARARPVPVGAARPQFRELDVQTGDLGRAAFDAAFSRFGVMFFAGPAAAFTNIRAALRPGGRLAFVGWRSVAENPMMSAPVAAAAPFLPPMPPSDPTAPGPFAFADSDRVRGILS